MSPFPITLPFQTILSRTPLPANYYYPFIFSDHNFVFLISPMHCTIHYSITPIFGERNCAAVYPQAQLVTPTHRNPHGTSACWAAAIPGADERDQKSHDINFPVRRHQGLRLNESFKLSTSFTFWRRNYFFLILSHPVYKM